MPLYECHHKNCPNKHHRTKKCPNNSSKTSKSDAKSPKASKASKASPKDAEKMLDILQSSGKPSKPTILWFLAAATGDTDGLPAQKDFHEAAQFFKDGIKLTRDNLVDFCTVLGNDGSPPDSDSESSEESDSSSDESDSE
jgi:hypothetical protein